MSGFAHDPLQTINLIADNLRDRYRDEAAVLKEIVQNADDAEADQLDFVLMSDGIPSAKNRLLRGPALVAINDGRFRQRDARGIRQFGLSVKSADQGAIGKFGLGQKAVFHLCEAFLYCAEGVAETEHPGFPYRGVINPWSEVESHHTLFPDWDDFSDDDWTLVHRELMPLGDFPRRFVLWLPLRSVMQLRHGTERVDPIVSHYPDPNDLIRHLCNSTILAECLPMLAHLKAINVHCASLGAGWRTLASYALAKNKKIQRLRRDDSSSEQRIELRGRVTIDRNGTNAALDFVGCQKLAMIERLAQLSSNDAWPMMYLRDEEGLAAIQSKEKASPQGAVMFYRRPSDQGASILTLDWAVFLPVSDRQREQIALKRSDGQPGATNDFHLVLHGYFFLDAGRQSIEAITDPSPGGIPKDEIEVRRSWNTTVRDELVLPTIPAVVAMAAQTLNLSYAELEAICDAVRNSSVWARHAEAITSQERFVCELKSTGPEWRLVTSDSKLRTLPRPPADERDRPWRVLPSLTQIQNDRSDVVFVVHDAPHLTTPNSLTDWSHQEVAELIAKASITVFSRRAHAAYLAAFLDTIPGLERAPAVGVALFELLRKALLTEGGPSQLTAMGQLIPPLLARISQERLIFLPSRASAPEVLVQLTAAVPSLLILPSILEPPDYARTELDAATAIELLAALHSLIETATDSVVDAASRAATEILSRTGRHVIALINDQRFWPLRVFRVRSWKAERFISVSYKELISANQDHRLFLSSPAETLPRLLQQALIDREILSIDREISLSINITCDAISAGSCLQAVYLANTLAAPEARARLLKQIRNADGRRFRTEFRFLCHGSANAKQNAAPLLVANLSELGELLRPLLDRRGENWRLLPEAISDVLTGELRRELGVESCDDTQIASQLNQASDDELALANDISDAARRRLFLAIQDRVTWRRLPVHHFVDGRSNSLDHKSFLQSDYPVPAILGSTVRLVQCSPDEAVAAQQQKFVESWGPVVLIEIALEEAAPHRFSNAILDALDDAPDQLSAELIQRLRQKPWLGLSSGPTRPEDILDLPEEVASEAGHILANQPERSFVTAAMVPSEIRTRRAWKSIEGLIQSDSAALDGLAMMLDGCSSAALAPDWLNDPVPIDAFKRLSVSGFDPQLRGWPLFAAALRKFSIEEIEVRLLPKLRGPLTGDNLRIVLQRIAEYDKGASHDLRQSARKVFAFYLRAALTCGEKASILAAIELPNRDGGWTSATQIASDAHGVVPTALLHADFSEFCKSPPKFSDLEHDSKPLSPGLVQTNSAARLHDYFDPWRDRVPMTPVGAFLALLGPEPDIEAFAHQCLREGQRDFDSTLLLIGGFRDRATAAGEFKELRARYRFVVKLAQGTTITLTALTGDRFEAARTERVDNLLVGDSLAQRIEGRTVTLELRPVDVTAMSSRDLIEALWAATDAVLADVYVVLKGGRDLLRENLFKPSFDSDVVAITIARERAIEGLTEQLKDLPLALESTLAQAQRAVEDAWRRKAQISSSFGNEIVAKAKRDLAEVVQNDSSAQQTLLDAMRRRIDEQEYRPDRVPFELFQNADDALLEAADGANPTGRALIEVDEHSLRLVHWGRPLNDLGPDPDLGRHRNYDMDLQKLLKLGFSQKTFDIRTTGRFGLGFKSVYLVTDAPLIASRWIAVRIRGTVMPEQAPDALDLVRQYPGERAATVIELPRRRDGPAPRDYAQEIYRSLGPLCVFAKAIRAISWRDAGKQVDVAWKPRTVAGIDGIEIGRLQFGSRDLAEGRALVFRHETEALLVRLDANGAHPLEHDVPTIWALAPTSELWKIGYLVNGQFRVDVGRSRLAGEIEDNSQRVARLGIRLGEQLVQLFKASQEQWPQLAAELELADSSPAAFANFWRSLFEVLSRGLNTGAPSEKFLGHLHKRRAGLAALVAQCPALPASFTSPIPRLVQFGSSLRYINGALVNDALRESVSSWPHAGKILDSCIDRTVADRCGELGLPSISGVGLRTLLRNELGEDARIIDTLAAKLGRTLHIENFEEIVPDPLERREIETEIRRCRFEAADGSWQPVAGLHTKDTGNADEDLYLAFTPPQAKLKISYSDEAKRFFLLARARSGFSPQSRTLADWARNAVTLNSRRGVLKYLLAGANAPALADILKERCPVWLSSSASLVDAELVADFTAVELTRLRAALFPETLTIQGPPDDQTSSSSPEAGRFFDVVHEWWTETASTPMPCVILFRNMAAKVGLLCLRLPHFRRWVALKRSSTAIFWKRTSEMSGGWN